MKKKKDLIICLFVVLFAAVLALKLTGCAALEIASTPGDISTFQILDTPGLYTITGTVTNGMGFNINSSDVIVDCQGNTIIYGGPSNNAFNASNVANVTIKNCIIIKNSTFANSAVSIQFTNVSNSFILNNTLLSNGTTGSTIHGIYLASNCRSNVINNNFIRVGGTTASHGIFIAAGSNSNNLTGNDIATFSSNSHAIFMSTTNSVPVANNLFINNRVNVSSTGGNEWKTDYSAGGSLNENNTAINLTLVKSGISISLTSYNGTAVKAINLTSGIPGLAGNFNISKFVNMTNSTGGAWMNLNFSYSDSDLPGGDGIESTLRVWRLNSTGSWANTTFYSGSYGVDTVNNQVFVMNITQFSTFGVFGFSDTISPSVLIASPSNSTYRNGTISFNVSLNEQGYCEYSLNSGATNLTMSANSSNSGFNATAILADGIYTARVYCNDSAGNLNYTESVGFSVDSVYPTIDFVNPSEANGTIFSRNTIAVNVTASDSGSGLKNITILLYNSTRNLISSNNSLASPNFINYTSLADGIYYFNATSYDNAGNSNSTGTRNVTIDTIKPTINFTNPTETNGSTFSRNTIAVNITAADTNLVNITIELFNSTGLVNSTTTTASPNFINYTSLADGIYYFNATAIDAAGNRNSSETKTLTIDSTPPVITITNPTATTYSANSYNILIGISEQGYCEYSLNSGAANVTLTNAGNTSFSGSKSGVANGNYVLTAYCNDSLGNLANKSVSFTVSVAAAVQESSGGASGYTPEVYNLTDSQFTEGFMRNIPSLSIYRFNFDGELYTLEVRSISNTVNIGISGSASINLNCPSGDSEQIDLNGDGVSDMILEIRSISIGKAEVYVKKIVRELAAPPISSAEKEVESPVVEKAASKPMNLWFIIIIALVIAAAIFIVYNISRHKK